MSRYKLDIGYLKFLLLYELNSNSVSSLLALFYRRETLHLPSNNNLLKNENLSVLSMYTILSVLPSFGTMLLSKMVNDVV